MSATAESQRRVTVSDRPDRTLLVFHAEKLHDDAVWDRVLPIAQALALEGIRLTFFVFPYRADAVGVDITPRVRELDRLGHEIAQHTHFYAGTTFMTDQKTDDLSDANVASCINRDAERLRAMGIEPGGFTAGAWQLPDAALETLGGLGFEYDCSARHPEPRARQLNPHQRWLTEARLCGRDRLILLPTTCSLGGWFKWGRRTVMAGPPDYQMVYLHDYDLLARRTRLLLEGFLRLRRGRMEGDARELARDVLAASRDHGGQ